MTALVCPLHRGHFCIISHGSIKPSSPSISCVYWIVPFISWIFSPNGSVLGFQWVMHAGTARVCFWDMNFCPARAFPPGPWLSAECEKSVHSIPFSRESHLPLLTVWASYQEVGGFCASPFLPKRSTFCFQRPILITDNIPWNKRLTIKREPS